MTKVQDETHDCKRNGTATLFAALDVLTGKPFAHKLTGEIVQD